MGSLWPSLVALLLCVHVFAQESVDFQYNGQPQEALTLERVLVETRTRTEMQDSTCTRQIPYQERECGNETRYRQECSWIPARQECGRRDERRCRDVTRYRQECSRGPSRERCQDFPGGEVCHNGPSREICEDRSGPEECRDTPNGRVCRRLPPTRNCRTVPGERICRPAPPQRRCETIPGEQICRQVPYQDQECSTTSVPYCYEVPGRQECRDIPYQEYVCRDVTRYRSETYACQRPVQIPYQVNIPVKANLDVSFVENDLGVEVPFTAVLNANKTLNLRAALPENVVMGLKVSEPQVSQNGDSFQVKQAMRVNLLSSTLIQNQLIEKLEDVVIDMKDKTLNFTATGFLEPQDRVEIVLEGKTNRRIRSDIVTKVDFATTLEKASIRELSSNTQAVQIDLTNVNLSVLSARSTFKVTIKHKKALSSEFEWSGPIPALESQKESTARAIK